MSIRSQLGLAARGVRLFAAPNARRIGLTLVLSLAVAVASAYEPLLLKRVVDRLGGASAAGVSGAMARQALVAVVTLFAAVLTGRILGAAWVTTSTCAVRLNMEYQVRSRVAAKLSVLLALAPLQTVPAFQPSCTLAGAMLDEHG